MLGDNLIGQQLGDFVIRERIGVGGMATVYRATQTSVNRDVALKVIDFSRAAQVENFHRRFAKEAALIASLEHIHILPVHDYGIQGELAYLAMRLMRGGSLRDILQNGPLTPEHAVVLFDQIARGLTYAHSKGVIHRDLKPGNIMLDEDGNAYLTDFGVAKLIGGTDLTDPGSVVGTVSYMSPEQLRGHGMDHRSDIYSLGVLLYQMLCGRTPFDDEETSDLVAIMYRHLHEAPLPPSQFRAEINPELEAVILRALAKDPAERYDSALLMAHAASAAVGHTIGPHEDPTSEYAQRSEDATSHEQVHIPLPSPLDTPVHQPGARPSLLVGGGVALVALVAVLIVVAVFLSRSSQQELRAHEVLAGVALETSEVTPTEEQITLAASRLGSDGFVAVIACNISSEYHATLNREIADFAAAYGLNLRIYNSDSDEYRQRTLMEEALIDGADAFIICPLDINLLEEPLQRIESAHLPLAIFSDPEHSYGGVKFAGQNDNYEMGLTAGRLAGQIIRDEMGGAANVVILDYPDLEIIVRRADGLEDGVLELAPEANIVGRYRGATRENGYAAIQQLIAADVDFNVIVSINDAGSYGAIDALVEAGFAPDAVVITSIDAERPAVKYIQEGHFLRGSLTVGRRESARTAVDLITIMLAGGSVPETVMIPSGEMVTAETAEEETGLLP